MALNDDETPKPNDLGDSQLPVESQTDPPALPERKNPMGRVQRENIYQRNQRNLQSRRQITANRAAHLRPQVFPQHDGGHQLGANGATNPASSTTPSEAEAEVGVTTNNDLNKIGGSQNTAYQAGTIHHTTYNITLTKDELGKEFVDGKFVELFASLGGLQEGNESNSAVNNPPKVPESLEEKFINGIQNGTTGGAFVHEARSRTPSGVQGLPKNDKEISRWYYQDLSERDRCFVKAAAVLHGAPLDAIAEATNELYAPLKAKDEARKAQQVQQAEPQTTGTVSPVTPGPAAPPNSMSDFLVRMYSLIQQEERARIIQESATKGDASQVVADDPVQDSLDSLTERTYTHYQRVNGATRLFWQDADSSGLSGFSLDVLRFLAREASVEEMFDTQAGQQFLDIIGQWPTKYQGERSWRSASALGVIWWHQNARNLLWKQASKWAKSQQAQDWEHAAALLDGAYQVEEDSLKVNANGAVSSSVLQLLSNWVNTAHQTQGERGEGYAAARAYALIGRKSPEIALNGLERLLCFPQPQDNSESPYYPPENLFIFGVLKYVDIVRSGHIRHVLKYLADGAERYAHWRGNPQMKGEPIVGYNQRAVALHVIFTVLFLVTSCSLSAVNEAVPASYSPTESLDEHPSCPDGEGRDVLLAGLLTEAEQPLWRKQLAQILCALIIEKNYKSALYLIRRWGKIVLQTQDPVLEATYIRFLVEVGELIRTWSTGRGQAQLYAFGTFRYELTLWLTDRRLPQPGFQKLAQKVLSHFPEVE
jgi:hypothetical protein